MNETTPAPAPVPVPKNNVFSLSWRVLAVVLLIIIAVMTALWRPWERAAAVRTISVQGEATVTAVPDTYDFQPIFENADLKILTATGNEAVAQLKKLGVKDTDIKTVISSAPVNIQPNQKQGISSVYPPVPVRSTFTYSITAKVHDKSLAQKVSDYLATTAATGEVTPAASFSKATQAKLDLEARSKASDDAKSKADVMAKQLGARVGRVSNISESGGYGIYAQDSVSAGSAAPVKSAAGPTIQPGTNDVNYAFTVVFELK